MKPEKSENEIADPKDNPNAFYGKMGIKKTDLASRLEKHKAVEVTNWKSSDGSVEYNTGIKYLVMFDDCCVEGDFKSKLSKILVDNEQDEYPQLVFENGIFLDNFLGCRLEAMESGVDLPGNESCECKSTKFYIRGGAILCVYCQKVFGEIKESVEE